MNVEVVAARDQRKRRRLLGEGDTHTQHKDNTVVVIIMIIMIIIITEISPVISTVTTTINSTLNNICYNLTYCSGSCARIGYEYISHLSYSLRQCLVCGWLHAVSAKGWAKAKGSAKANLDILQVQRAWLNPIRSCNCCACLAQSAYPTMQVSI